MDREEPVYRMFKGPYSQHFNEISSPVPSPVSVMAAELWQQAKTKYGLVLPRNLLETLKRMYLPEHKKKFPC